MLHNQLKVDYFKNERKFIIPKQSETESNARYAATVAADFASNGFAMDKSAVDALSHCSVDDIVEFHRTYIPVIKNLIGSDKEYRPFYPNFPEEVMGKSDFEFFIDQVIYGLSDFEIKPEVYEDAVERFPFVGETYEHIVSAGSENDYHESMNTMMRAAVAYSPAQRGAIANYFKYSEKAVENIPSQDQMKNHENRVVVACAMEDAGKMRNISRVLTDATDALRYASVRSAERDMERGKNNVNRLKNAKIVDRQNGNDEETKRTLYSYSSLRFDKNDSPSLSLSRKQRKIVADILEKSAKQNPKKLAAEMTSHKREWKRLIKNMHINDMPEYPTVQKACEMISTNQKGINPRGEIEKAIQSENIDDIMSVLSKKPGEMMRRIDKVFRIAEKADRENGTCENVGKVLDYMAPALRAAGVATLYSLDANLKDRTNPESVRVFKTPSNGKIIKTEEKNREPLSEDTVSLAHEQIWEALRYRYEGKADMGKVFVGQEMKDYTIPTGMRDAEDAINAYGPGSKIPMKEQAVKRFFIHWKDTEKSRVDLDLSASLYDKEGNNLGNIGWNADKWGNAYAFSGDVQDGGPVEGPGVAEFVDVDVKKLQEQGVRYIVPSVNSFTGQPFISLSDAKFGVMERDEVDKGKVFEPTAVTEEFRLSCKGTSVVPVIVDLDENKMIWVDQPYYGRVATHDQSEIQAIMQSATRGSVSIADVAVANAVANGELVYDPFDADTIFTTPDKLAIMQEEYSAVDFSEKKIVFPYDMSYLMGEMMADGNPEIATQRRNDQGLELEG